MRVPPKQIIHSAIDKIAIVDGVCAQDFSPPLQPGMPVKIVSGPKADGNEYTVDNLAFSMSDLKPALGAVAVENISMGIGVDYNFSYNENIKVVFLSPGVMFWGRVKNTDPLYGDIAIGDYITLDEDLPTQARNGYFCRYPLPGFRVDTAVYAVALTSVSTSDPGIKWLLMRAINYK